MTATILDGKATAAAIKSELADRVAKLKELGISPGLGTVLVGDDPGSHSYVAGKHRDCAEVGITSHRVDLPADASQAQVDDAIAQLNEDPTCTGYIVQLPLPKGLDELAVISAIDPDKDVDGLHVVNAGRLASGLPGLVSCTPLGCMMLIRDTLGDTLSGKEAVVIGRSILVGKPVAQLLLAANCTVTMAHSRTQNLPEVVRRADIVVAAVGRPEMVKADWIKRQAVHHRCRQPLGFSTRQILSIS